MRIGAVSLFWLCHPIVACARIRERTEARAPAQYVLISTMSIAEGMQRSLDWFRKSCYPRVDTLE